MSESLNTGCDPIEPVTFLWYCRDCRITLPVPRCLHCGRLKGQKREPQLTGEQKIRLRELLEEARKLTPSLGPWKIETQPEKGQFSGENWLIAHMGLDEVDMATGRCLSVPITSNRVIWPFPWKTPTSSCGAETTWAKFSAFWTG